MSRLYEALSRSATMQRQPALAPQDLNPVDEVSAESKKTARVLSHLTLPKPVEIPAAVGADDVIETRKARVITARVLPQSHLVAWSDPNSLGAEKFRALATRLDHLRKQSTLRSLQVTSSVINEGKTLVAANLAVTLAKYSGAKTLLLEGDLHSPTLASLFGLSGLQGLAQWWPGDDREIGHFLYQFDGMPLWLLAAGKTCEQPSHILSSARFAAAFRQLVDSFDWIVVDSTPMLPIIDANLWSRLVDGTLLVVREGVAPVRALKKGLQSLDHPKLIGIVVNHASQCDQGSYEGHYCST